MKRLCIFLPFLLVACALGPDYVRPEVATPPRYKEAGDWKPAVPNDEADRGPWWSLYHDDILNSLEQQIDVSNQNIKAAEAAYRQATALADEARASLFPIISTAPSITRSGTGAAHVDPKTTYSLSAKGSWEPDIWGRLRRNVESEDANAEASAADLAAARLSAQAALATAYFDLRGQDALKRMLEAARLADVRILQITQNRYHVGLAAQADVLAARTQMETVQAAVIHVDMKRAQLEHALAVLLGMPPATFSVTPTQQKLQVPALPEEVPSVLLERRPDIAASERAVAAANAQIGVATAAWFPDLTLSGSYGTTALALSKILQASSSVWSFGPTLAETIFDGGARAAALEQAEAGYDQKVATYRQTVLTAFQQVEDNLVALRVLGEEAQAQQSIVGDARKTVELTLNQYKQGVLPYSSVLTAQVTALNDQQNALAVRTNRLDASVALIEALGGGWRP